MISDHIVDEANYAYLASKNRQAIEWQFITPLRSRRVPEPPNSKVSMRDALEAVAPLIREDVLKELDERLKPEARHEQMDGIWAAQNIIAEMLEEQR